jgi:hypothetical protein
MLQYSFWSTCSPSSFASGVVVVLIGVTMSVRPLGVEQTSRLGLRDPVASGLKCGSHGGKKSKTKSWTVFWLSLKTKVEPGLHGSQVMSGDWREVTPSLWGFQWFSTKPLGSLVDPQSQDRRTLNTENPKIEPLNSQIWEGNQRKKNHEGFTRISPSNPQEQGPENTPRKPPREGSENHHQEQPGTTQQSLEEPHRIIYTCQEGSYKV